MGTICRGSLGEVEATRGRRLHEDDPATLVAHDVGVGQRRGSDVHLHAVEARVGLVPHLELTPQGQRTGRGDNLGLLVELPVRRRLEVLTGIDVATDQAPLLGVDPRMLVALLEE